MGFDGFSRHSLGVDGFSRHYILWSILFLSALFFCLLGRYCPRCGRPEHAGTLCSPNVQVREQNPVPASRALGSASLHSSDPVPARQLPSNDSSLAEGCSSDQCTALQCSAMPCTLDFSIAGRNAGGVVPAEEEGSTALPAMLPREFKFSCTFLSE